MYSWNELLLWWHYEVIQLYLHLLTLENVFFHNFWIKQKSWMIKENISFCMLSSPLYVKNNHYRNYIEEEPVGACVFATMPFYCHVTINFGGTHHF